MEMEQRLHGFIARSAPQRCARFRVGQPPAVAQLLECTTRIACHQKNAKVWLGSGTIVGRDKEHFYVLSCAHVVTADDVQVEVFSAVSLPFPEKVFRSSVAVVARWDEDDLVLLQDRTDDLPVQFLQVCPPSLPVTLHQKVLLPNCGAGKSPHLIEGDLQGRSVHGYWRSAMKTERGASGSGLVQGGVVIGVHVRASRDEGFAVHLDTVQAFLTREGFSWLMTNPVCEHPPPRTLTQEESLLVAVWVVIEICITLKVKP